MKVKKRPLSSSQSTDVVVRGGGSYHAIIECGGSRQSEELLATRVLAGKLSANSRLLSAIEQGSVALLKEALSDGATLKQRDEMGETPLFWAIRHRAIEVVQIVLAQKADVSLGCVVGVL